MKKLYSFILTALLLLGASNAWGTTYKLGHNGVLINNENDNDWPWSDAMTDTDGDGTYEITFTNVNHGVVKFKVIQDASWWGSMVDSHLDNANSDVTLSIDNGNVKFTLTGEPTPTVKIYLKTGDNPKVYVKVPTYSVTISTNWDLCLFPYASYDGSTEWYKYFGNWPGAATGTSHTFNVIKNTPLYIKINDKDGREGGTHETAGLSLGKITKDLTLQYEFSTWSAWSNNKYYIKGIDDDWDTFNYGFEGSDQQAIVNLTAEEDYEFKILNGTSWFGHYEGSHVLTTSIEIVTSGDTNGKVKFTPSQTGDHLFTLTGSSAPFTLSVVSPNSTYERTVSVGDWGTICLPYAVAASAIPSGVKFYSIEGKRLDANSQPTSLVLAEEDELEAGQPYIFNVETAQTDNKLSLAYGTSASLAGIANGLIGTYVEKNVANENYIIFQGAVRKVAVTSATVKCGANRAYIDMTQVNPFEGAPGRRIIDLDFATENATALENTKTSENTVKFFENGKLYILREGVVYDATGRTIR